MRDLESGRRVKGEYVCLWIGLSGDLKIATATTTDPLEFNIFQEEHESVNKIAGDVIGNCSNGGIKKSE